MDIVLKNLIETQELGKKLAHCCSSLQNPFVIYLIGDLGVGKTTLAQSFIQYFGFKRVKSPTYSLVESYQNKNINIHHFDCYRLSNPEELEYIGIRDYLLENNLQLIEWPELGKGVIADSDLSIELSGDGDQRSVNLQFQSDIGKYIRCAATVSDSSAIQIVSITSNTAIVNAMSVDVSLSTTTPKAGDTITATAVVLGGVVPVTTAYQWKADGVNIIGATSATYVVEVATDGKRLSCQITTTDGDNTNAVKTSTQTNPVASGDVPEINTVTLAEVTPDSPDRFTDQSFTVAVDMTKDNPKSDYAIRGKVLGDLTVDVETSVITKLEEEAVSGAWTAGTLAEDNGMVSVAYGAGKFVAVSQNGTNRLQYSADGVNWTAVSLESISTTAQWVSVAYGNGYFVAINSNGTGTPNAFKANTSLGFGHSTGVDPLPFMYEIRKQLNINVSLNKKIHIIALPQ